MPVYFASLNSGSNGNCYYIGNQTEAILIDAGISCKEVERRMHRLGLDCRKLKAVFISHEHSDHISGLATLANKYSLPVYITSETLRGTGLRLQKDAIVFFNESLPVSVGSFSVTPFRKRHDACDPHSFVVSCEGLKVGVFTDIGHPCEQLVYHFRQCNAAFLESNYDEAMLMNGRYPYFLKNRIRGGLGHLSNTQAFQLFTQHRPSFMSHLLLSHLSKENNRPELVQELFASFVCSTYVGIASRYEETPVFEIRESFVSPTAPPRPAPRVQLSLF